jgi:hypothetical protein
MSELTTDHEGGGLAGQAVRPQAGIVFARDLKFGDVVVRVDPVARRTRDVRPREPDADTGPQRLAALVVAIAPVLTAMMTMAWLWFR